jgi:myo-inositol catabolism protein IolC
MYDLYVKQDKKCALSGVKIYLPKNTCQSWTASVDRIDSSKGYIVGNLQWVHKDVNWMKNDFDQKHFINTCSLIAKNFKGRRI